MKTIKTYIILILALFTCISNGYAQTDSRNRTKETIIQDGLAELPATDPKTYERIMGEFAMTGAEGVELLCNNLQPNGKNATFEHAINGVVNYVSAEKQKNLRQGVKDGLKAGFRKASTPEIKNFLISQIQKIADASDAPFFVENLSKQDTQDASINALCSVKGTDAAVKEVVLQGTAAPKSALAYMAYTKQLSGVEDNLLSWLNGANESDTKAILNALTVCGTKKSLPVLEQKAAQVQYGDDATGATDAYLRFLCNSNDQKTVLLAANKLMKQSKTPSRTTGLQMLLNNDTKNASKNVLKALKDPCRTYRQTALTMAPTVCGEGIFAQVTDKFKKGDVAVQTDIVRWLGNNKRTQQEDFVITAMNAKDVTLTKAAIEAAGKIGTPKMLNALTDKLGTEYTAEAQTALASFPQDISQNICSALQSSDNAKVKNALQVASSRHIRQAYPQVLQLTKSADADLKAEALQTLPNVVDEANFNEVCTAMEQAGNDAKYYQVAAKSAIHQLPTTEQFERTNARLSATKNPELYYPLLAQVGNHEAINKLMQEYKQPTTKAAAEKALLDVDNDEMIENLYQMALAGENNSNEIVKRYLALVKKSALTAEEKNAQIERLSNLKSLQPARVSEALAIDKDTQTPLALYRSYQYLCKESQQTNETVSRKAASVLEGILLKNKSLLGGAMAKEGLQKSLAVFQSIKGDADAEYETTQINELLSQVGEEGFVPMQYQSDATKTIKFSLPDADGKAKTEFENFELTFYWQSTDNATLYLRSMPLITLNDAGVTVSGSSQKVLAAEGKNLKNVLYVKMINDRLHIENNGKVLVTNYVVENPYDGKSLRTKGTISIKMQDGNIQVANPLMRELPSTPIFTLSEEEAKAGYEVLFDGRDLSKWQGNKKDYVPLDGNIYVSAKYGGKGNLYSNKTYSDFVYRFEFCFVEPGVNNGIGIRTHLGTDAAYDGMEIQVLDHDDPIYKGLHDYQQHGSVYGIIVPKHVQFGALNTWNTEEIRAEGDHIKVTVNGEVVLDGNIREACQGHNVAPDGGKVNPYTVDKKNHPGLFNKEGYISFCGHGVGVKFRNVRILDLSKKTTAKGKKK